MTSLKKIFFRKKSSSPLETKEFELLQRGVTEAISERISTGNLKIWDQPRLSKRVNTPEFTAGMASIVTRTALE